MGALPDSWKRRALAYGRWLWSHELTGIAMGIVLGITCASTFLFIVICLTEQVGPLLAVMRRPRNRPSLPRHAANPHRPPLSHKFRRAWSRAGCAR